MQHIILSTLTLTLLAGITCVLPACGTSPQIAHTAFAETEQFEKIGQLSARVSLTTAELEAARQQAIRNLTRTPGSTVVEREPRLLIIDSVWTKQQLDQYKQTFDETSQYEWPEGMLIAVRYAIVTKPAAESDIGEVELRSWLRRHDARVLSDPQKHLLWLIGIDAVGHNLLDAEET